MSVLGFAFALFQALAAIPAILKYVQDFAAGAALWYVQGQTQANLHAIADAASLSARAQTKEDRDEALDAWRSALSRPRILP